MNTVVVNNKNQQHWF